MENSDSMKVLASILLCSVFAASALEVRKLKVEIVVICRGMVERFGTRLRELALCFQRWAGTRAHKIYGPFSSNHYSMPVT